MESAISCNAILIYTSSTEKFLVEGPILPQARTKLPEKYTKTIFISHKMVWPQIYLQILFQKNSLEGIV